jgi:hypothetical protein
MTRPILSQVFSLTLVLALLLVPAPARAQDAGTAITRLRIGVTTDSITVLGPQDLAAAGLNPAGVDPRTFALSSLGQPVAIYVTGETDGRFDAQDRIYFFGQRFRGPEMEQKYTDERVYWLTTGGAAGPRMAAVEAVPVGDLTPPQDFATTLRAEESFHWWTLHRLGADTEDTWFWAQLQPLGAGQVITASLPYNVPHPAPGTTATLRLEKHSRAGSAGVNPDHRTTIALNGAPVLDQAWDGLRVRKVFSAAIPAGLLQHGVNTVQVGAWVLPGVTADWVYANYWELDYRRQFRAWNGQLDFAAETPGPAEYAVGGWTDPNVAIWDVSNPASPRRLLTTFDHHLRLPLVFGGAQSPAAGLAGDALPAADTVVRFRADGPAGARYWLQAQAAFRAPASVLLRGDTGLRSPAGGADAVIVTSAELRPAAERLATWHRNHDRRALVVDLQDVYDEFNAGIYHPKAVPAMLKWAAANWPQPAPAFLTLMGDGHWNFKSFNPALYPPQPNHIPPYLAWVDRWQGEVPADALYGDLDGDMVPEIAVGRLAVNTLAEANIVVDKILNYDQGARSAAWQRKVLFVADNPDPASGDYPAVSDQIIAGHIPQDLQVTRAYISRSSSPPTQAEIQAARNTISDTLQSGVWMVQFAGHGAIPLWTHEVIWQTADVPGLRNADRLPVVMTFNCLDGYFAHPVTFSLAETMQRHAGGGSIAAISPSGLGLTADQHEFRKLLMNVMFKENVRELGTALTIAKRQYYQLFGNDYLIQTMTLFGDPALRLPGPAVQ